MRKNRALEQVKALLQADAACVHQNGVVGLFERGHGAVAVLVVALPDVGQHGGKIRGLALLGQFLGAALGAGIGALTGAIVKHGVDKDFQDRVRNLLSTDDSAAVFMVVDEMTTDKFIDAIRPFGGDVLQTSLSIKDEEELKCELGKC